jgi:mono/diheme cytochrome c family protein
MRSLNPNRPNNAGSRTPLALCGSLLLTVLAACGSPPPKDRGAQLYVGMCQSCHQSNGQGAKGLYAPLAGTPVPNGDPEEMISWIMYGDRPASLPRGQFSGAMPQFGFLSDQDAAAVVTFVRRSFGNHASEVTPDVVARVRARHAAR